MQRDQGAVLIVVLWLVTILAITAAGIAYTQRTEIRVTRNWMDRSHAYNLARAGVEKAIAALHVHGGDKKHLPGAAWWSGEKEYAKVELGDGRFTVSPHLIKDPENASAARDKKTSTYGLGDEESKINVNNATWQVLAKLPDMRPDLAKAIERKRKELMGEQSKDTSLVTTLAEARQEKEAKKKSVLDHPFHTLRDLLHVPGMTEVMLFGDGKEKQGLSVYLTTRSNGRINVNSAPAPVIQALGVKAETLPEIEKQRSGTAGGFETVEAFLNASDLLKQPPAPGEAPEPLEKVKERYKKQLDVRSSNFSLVSVGHVGGSPRAVVHARLSLEKDQIRVVAWRTEYLPPLPEAETKSKSKSSQR